MSLIYLPVSLGEAIDKLTILDIKLEKITDHRRNDVEKERELLYDKLKEFIIEYNELYEMMKKVNLYIWDMMDVLRDGDIGDEDYIKECRECIEYNDIRFRIKNKINYVSNSALKEQKGYKTNRILVEIPNDIPHINRLFNPIKYYSLIYDEIVIINNNEKVKEYFNYDPTIRFIESISNIPEYKKRIEFENRNYENEEINEKFDITNTKMAILL